MSLEHLVASLPWSWGPNSGIEPPRDIAGTVRLASRAVETNASPEALYLWLCQLRRAPYSYDGLDNFGCRSPREPDTSMRELKSGQRVMTIFSLTDFVPNRSLTISMRAGLPCRLFGAITVRYAIVPVGNGRALLRGDLWMPRLGGPLGDLRRTLLAWGDVLMMRKQLRTLAWLAEQTSARSLLRARDQGSGG
ncbi:MAG: SRPBCC family protein [Brevibacterium sp.]